MSTIARHALDEGWDDAKATERVAKARSMAMAAVHGKIPLDESKKAVEADVETQRRAALLNQHRDEPRVVRERLYSGLKAHRAAQKRADKLLAFEDLKAAKIASETLLNLHRAERQAWGYETSGILLGDGDGNARPGGVVVEVVFVNPGSSHPSGRVINQTPEVHHEGPSSMDEPDRFRR